VAGRLLHMSRNARRWQLVIAVSWVLIGLWWISRGVFGPQGTGSIILGFLFAVLGPAYAWFAYKQSTTAARNDQQQPINDQQPPTHDSQPPTYDQQQPTYDRQSPTYDQQQLTHDQQQPTYDRQLPTYDRQPPISER
jgi:hypothetical protein